MTVWNNLPALPTGKSDYATGASGRVNAVEFGRVVTAVQDLRNAVAAMLSETSSQNSGDVSLGAATNGLSLLNQVLQNALATPTSAGAMSALDKSTVVALGVYAINGGGTVDDINAGLTAMRALGLHHFHLGDGVWTKDVAGQHDNAILIPLHDDEIFSGNGMNRSVIRVTGTTMGDGDDGVAVLGYAPGSSNITIEDIHIDGDNSGPFVRASQNQNAAIYGGGVGSSQITVRRCVFTSLFGFAVHSENHVRTHVEDCLAIDVANSLANVNGDRIKIHGNVCTGGEFAECSGTNVSIQGNVCYAISGIGITIGGNQTPGSSYPGNSISGNIIDTVTDGAAITVTDGAGSTSITGNILRKADLGGIIVSAPLNPPDGLQISGNILESNCKSPGVNVVGIDIRDGNRHMVFNNNAQDLGVSGYEQKYALKVQDSADIMVVGNRLGGTLKDASYTNGATNVFEDGNQYVNGFVEFTGTATRATKTVFSKALTDLIVRHQLPGESPGVTRGRFALELSGKLWWGDGSNVNDTNLYRSAADTLKTDDAFVASNIAAGATVAGANTGDQTNISGNAATATKLATARNISGQSFDGSAAITIPFSGLSGGIDDTQHGSRGGGSLHPNAVASGAAGFMTGADKAKLDAISGTNTGDQTSVSGNAGTATTLQTARKIDNVSFNGSADILTAWNMARKPASAHTYDDEFEAGSIDAAWALGGTQVGTAIDPYGNFSTAGNWRFSINSMRPSWLMIQPAADGNYFFPLHKPITVPTDFMIWARVAFNTRSSATQTNQDAGIGLCISASSSSAPDLNNIVQAYVMETDANQKSIQIGSVAASVAATTIRQNWSNLLPIDSCYVLIQKISTTYHIWFSTGGNWLWVGSYTNAASMDRVSIRAANASTSTPGNMVVGIDFIRFYAGKDWLP